MSVLGFVDWGWRFWIYCWVCVLNVVVWGFCWWGVVDSGFGFWCSWRVWVECVWCWFWSLVGEYFWVCSSCFVLCMFGFWSSFLLCNLCRLFCFVLCWLVYCWCLFGRGCVCWCWVWVWVFIVGLCCVFFCVLYCLFGCWWSLVLVIVSKKLCMWWVFGFDVCILVLWYCIVV